MKVSKIKKWGCGVVVKHADSQHRDCQLDSSICHSKNTIGEEGNRKPPHEFHFPRKNSEPCLWFLLCSKLSMLHKLKIVKMQHIRYTRCQDGSVVRFLCIDPMVGSLNPSLAKFSLRVRSR